jgi:hypothetical protein
LAASYFHFFFDFIKELVPHFLSAGTNSGRLISMEAFTGLTTNWSTGSATTDYANDYTYDANGNILTLDRTGVTTQMDNFTYNYTAGTNKLDYVNDVLANNANYTDDIDNGQATLNYTYTEIGELKTDVQENISLITWRVDGKVKKVERNATGKNELEFKYDAFGRRVCKISKPTGAGGTPNAQDQWTYTYYVNDASGNVMSTYTLVKGATTHELDLQEQMIYGATRLGYLTRQKLIADKVVATSVVTQAPADELEHNAGTRRYEFTNHLGNVLLVTSDRRLAQYVSTAFTHFEPDIIAYSDYYPFNLSMPGRVSNPSGYRYGQNGQEKESEVTGSNSHYSAEYWMYDARLGRRWEIDPLTSFYPSMSPYAAFNNNPIYFSDPLGLEGEPEVGSVCVDEANVLREYKGNGEWGDPSGNGSVTYYMTPNGGVITLPTGTPTTLFGPNQETALITNGVVDVIPGSLEKFIYDGKEYKAAYLYGVFKGYTSDQGFSDHTHITYGSNTLPIVDGSSYTVMSENAHDGTVLEVGTTSLVVTLTEGAASRVLAPVAVVKEGYELFYMIYSLYNLSELITLLPPPPTYEMSKTPRDHMKGGKQNSRDKDFGIKDKKFWRWWHRKGKPENGGGDIENKQQADQIYKDWIERGKPKAK